MLFSKEDLRGMHWGDSDLTVVEDTIIDTGRWSIHHRAVFQDSTGHYFSTTYSVGATESQDERPYDCEPDQIECKAVFPTKKEITVYE